MTAIPPDPPLAVLVAGASRGIGLAIVERALAAGHRVVAISRSASPVDAATETIGADVRDPRAVADAVAEAHARLGRIDAAVYVAGIAPSGPIESIDDESVHDVFATNVFGAISLARALLPIMRRAGRGRIVNVSSQSAHLPSPFFGLYGASKAALEHLTISLDREAQPFGVSARLVVPGSVRTTIRDTAAAREVDGDGSVYGDALRVRRDLATRAVAEGIDTDEVAEAVLRVLDADAPMRTVVGADARFAVERAGLWGDGVG